MRAYLIPLAAAAVVSIAAFNPESPPTSQPAAEPAPASAPASETEEARVPRQIEILRDLIRERQRPTPIIPSQQRIEAERPSTPARPSEPVDPRLLPDGSSIVERPGRFAMENQRPVFIFRLEGDPEPRTLELHRNQLLEIMERTSASGVNEFVVTGEVTRYRGKNYLFLWKVLERVSNGNLTP